MSREERTEEGAIDNVLATQPELGPMVPDGGYGWLVFLATLFFQALIPGLIVSFGIFLAFLKLPNLTKEDVNPKLWDESLMYTPLMFIASWTSFDPMARNLISQSTWPRLVATSGTCLICAGLLFLWMGMAGYVGNSIYAVAGLLSGIGASVQIAQCEILVAQYFRKKHTILVYITQGVTALGFVVTPIIVGHHVLSSNLLHVILWYQAVILQGLICNLFFKKPAYLKSNYNRNKYNYILSNPDDEEDIFSKNSRELQITRQNSNGGTVVIEKHEITSSSPDSKQETHDKKDWEKFEDDSPDMNKKYGILNVEWETFEDDEDEATIKPKKTGEKSLENDSNSNITTKNLQSEMSSAVIENNGPTTSVSGMPMPLFADLPVNNNNTYSYEVLDEPSSTSVMPSVFMPTVQTKSLWFHSWDLLRQPTFYKSLLTVVTTKYSLFIYYTLFPCYLYQEIKELKMRGVAALIGVLSLGRLFFAAMAYWVNVDKKRRPICLWFLCWVGSFGYFMISDSNTKQVLTFGAIQVTLSIASLQYVGMPLLGFNLKGETCREFNLISTLTGCAFLLFIFINSTFKDCFRLMALLHFFTGLVWFLNYIYKKILR